MVGRRLGDSFLCRNDTEIMEMDNEAWDVRAWSAEQGVFARGNPSLALFIAVVADKLLCPFWSHRMHGVLFVNNVPGAPCRARPRLAQKRTHIWSPPRARAARAQAAQQLGRQDFCSE